MRTAINGKEAEWTDEIRAKWAPIDERRAPGTVIDVNYFTPRPDVDQYNRGSREEGFTFSIQPPNSASVPQVWQAIIRRHDQIGGDL